MIAIYINFKYDAEIRVKQEQIVNNPQNFFFFYLVRYNSIKKKIYNAVFEVNHDPEKCNLFLENSETNKISIFNE